MKLHIGERDDISNFLSDKYLKINSCGIQQNNGTEFMTVRKNGRQDFHILYIAKGICHVEHNEKEYQLKNGDFVLYFPNEPQKYKFSKCNDTFSYWIHFTGTAVAEIFSDINLKSGVYTMQENKMVNVIFNKIITFYSLGKPKYELQANACLLNLISVLALNETEKYNTAYPDFIIDTVKYINLNWQKQISVTHLAKLSNLSPSRFAHLFKDHTGISPLFYITRIKIEKAKELLINTDMSVSDISETVGYNDALYFSRIFKKHTNYPPGHFRK